MAIAKYFKDRDCFTLIRPVSDESKLSHIDDIKFEESSLKYLKALRKKHQILYFQIFNSVERDIRKIKNDLRFVRYDQQYETHDGKIKFSYLNSGHIPGGASILLEIEGKKLLYTADLNTEDTNLMIQSEIDNLQGIDILITENTYGDREHPDKKDSEEGLIDSVEECLKGGGSALIPVFGVGRSQEILIILSKLSILQSCFFF